MMARAGLRIGVVGATGTLGTELLELLDRSSLRVSEIVPIATDRSFGRDIEFQGLRSGYAGVPFLLLHLEPANAQVRGLRAQQDRHPNETRLLTIRPVPIDVSDDKALWHQLADTIRE